MVAQNQYLEDAQLAHKAELKERLQLLSSRELRARTLHLDIEPNGLQSKPSLSGRYMQQDIFTVADARRTLEDILAQEAASKKKIIDQPLEHPRRQPPPVEPQSRIEMSSESEEKITPEAPPSMQDSALAHADLPQKPIETGVEQFNPSRTNQSTSPRHAGIKDRWLKWGFWLGFAVFLFLPVSDYISKIYNAPLQHLRIILPKFPMPRTFIYHTAFPQHITSRRDILHDFKPYPEPPSSQHIDVDSMRKWSCSGSGSLHLHEFPQYWPNDDFGPYDILTDVLYCPDFPEPDHISAAQLGKEGSGLRFVKYKRRASVFDENSPVVPRVTLRFGSGGYRTAIDDRSRVTFQAYVWAPKSQQQQLSRPAKWRRRLVDDPIRLYTGDLEDLGSE